MFYSHEILTSRKYGVATVWLVATLGAKSNTRKVTRKAILNVDVQKACETIIQPDAPMALRLQSNLLYGVSRVYDQQCHYVLLDAQAAQNSMRALFKIVRSGNLDSAVSKARPDQLMLMDDPAFDPDHALPALDMDFSHLELEAIGDTQRSSQSMMSVSRKRTGSVSSHRGSVGINLPSSSGHGGSYQLPSNDHFGHSSVLKAFGGTGRDILDDEAELYQDDIVFEFDEFGQMRDIDDQEQARRAGSIHPFGRIGSDSAASGRVRKEHEDAAATGRLHNAKGGDADFDMGQFGDDGMVLPEAEPFPMMSGALGMHDRPPLNAQDRVYSEEPSSDTAGAAQKFRKPRARKALVCDRATELSSSVLVNWQHGYLNSMKLERDKKFDNKDRASSKKNAFSVVWATGLNGVGDGVGLSKLPSPLDMFSGEALFTRITGKSSVEAPAKSKKPSKHSLDVEDEQNPLPPKRARLTPGAEDEIGRGIDEDIGMIDDDGIIMHDSSNPEIGRDAASALQDHPSSVQMPWNLSQSLHSHQRAASSSIHKNKHGLPGSRRHTSASPLIGRGSALPEGMVQFPMLDDEVMYGRSDDGADGGSMLPPPRSSRKGYSSSQVEFEMFGPAAQVDTQMAATSQWVSDILDRESGNFFEYVRNTIAEKGGVELLDGGEQVVEGEVTFEELFDPFVNSAAVAAQAFYHVLSLATKGKVWVDQDEGEAEEAEPFGEIRIGVLV